MTRPASRSSRTVIRSLPTLRPRCAHPPAGPDDADQILKDTNLKAEAIDQLAREQAIAQARKMVQSATDETREIQNAHRLRLQDLKSRISEMERPAAR